VVAVLGMAMIYNVALALGAGSSSIRHYHDPPGSTVEAFAVLAAWLAAFVLSVISIRRPLRVVALFVPLYALYMLVSDFTYDSYYAPQLQRYWDGAGDHTRIYVGVAIAFVVGAGLFRFPRAAGAVNLVALPATFVLTIAYLGH
jgi:uncharacterized membrane protein